MNHVTKKYTSVSWKFHCYSRLQKSYRKLEDCILWENWCLREQVMNGTSRYSATILFILFVLIIPKPPNIDHYLLSTSYAVRICNKVTCCAHVLHHCWVVCNMFTSLLDDVATVMNFMISLQGGLKCSDTIGCIYTGPDKAGVVVQDSVYR